MLGLQIFVFSLQTILIVQTAEMKITFSPQQENFVNQKAKYGNIFKTDSFNKQNVLNNLPIRNILKSDSKKKLYLKNEDEMKCRPFILTKQEFDATHNNSDLNVINPNFRSKRDYFINQINNGNHTFNVSKHHIESSNSYKGDLNLINRDYDSFYDNELIRKVSDNNGNLPSSLKLFIHEDKDPVVISEEGLKNSKLEKRNLKSTKSNVYYDYDYYDDQSFDSSPLKSGEYNVRKNFSSAGKIINHVIKSSNSSVSGGNKGVINTATVSVLTGPKVTASITVTEENLSIKPHFKDQIDKRGEERSINGSNVKNTTVKFMNSLSNNQIKAAPKKKGTCLDSPGEQGCHPGGGLPKYPGISAFEKKSQDPAYDKLIKGETSEKVVKSIIDRVQRNSRMATELGICDFDIAELRTLFKQMRSKDKKECCLKLKGEFKCFMNWLLTIEPSRKKRSDYSKEKVGGFTSCKKFPKFSVLDDGDYCKPSLQYEKLVEKVAEYREESNDL